MTDASPSSTPPDPASAAASETAATDPSELTMHIPPGVDPLLLHGASDTALTAIERALPALVLHVRGNVMTLRGPRAEVDRGQLLLDSLLVFVSGGEPLTPELVSQAVGALADVPRAGGDPGRSFRPDSKSLLTESIVSSRGRSIRPKTMGQRDYVDAIENNTVVFGIGPAGTGKTYLAVAKAVQALQARRVERIVLTRPAVEAGERLGYLPGTLSDKIDPYLRPLYDALHDMMDPESIPRLMAAGTIEVAPLAYMRGRTLNDAFVILDEAQNTTPEQMKMFLTRLGFGSSMVITGDVTQVDLPGGSESGLRIIEGILGKIDDIAFRRLGAEDVVRHRLVSEIVSAYGRWDER